MQYKRDDHTITHSLARCRESEKKNQNKLCASSQRHRVLAGMRLASEKFQQKKNFIKSFFFEIKFESDNTFGTEFKLQIELVQSIEQPKKAQLEIKIKNKSLFYFSERRKDAC